MANNTVNNTANNTAVNTVTNNTYSYVSTKENYDKKGTKNKTKFTDFIKICKMKQKTLKIYLELMLENLGYEDIISGDGYVYAKGDIPVLLTAHMDTVHSEPVKSFYEYHDKNKNQHIISSPQGIGGDDRCGIYMILEIAKTHKCSILFCEDEESGCIGSKKFCETEYINELAELKYMIELDRKNGDDAVFYQCDSEKFTKFIEDNTGFTKAWGSCSDISHLAPAAKIAAVNLSCGYYNAHTTSEYVIVEEMLNTIEVVKKLLNVECEQFEYVKKTYNYNYGGYYNRNNDYGYDEDYYEHRSATYGYYQANKYRTFYIYVLSEDGTDYQVFASNARSATEALGKFFIANKTMCYDDIFNYEDAGSYVITDGWFTDRLK